MPPRRLRPLNPAPLVSQIPGVLPEDIVILPRQPGESAYQYRYRRTVALYGQTPYQRRRYLAGLRGITGPAARGHPTRGGESESQRRNRLSMEQFGQSVSQLYRAELREWLIQHGYTPENTQMSWTQLLRLGPRLRWMYDSTGEGGRVTPDMISRAVDLEDSGELESGWAFERLWQKYDDMVAYRSFSDKTSGRDSWAEYQQIHVFIPELEPQWWYYR